MAAGKKSKLLKGRADNTVLNFSVPPRPASDGLARSILLPHETALCLVLVRLGPVPGRPLATPRRGKERDSVRPSSPLWYHQRPPPQSHQAPRY